MSGNNYDLLESTVIQNEFRRGFQPSVMSINRASLILADAKTDIVRTFSSKHGHYSDTPGQGYFLKVRMQNWNTASFCKSSIYLIAAEDLLGIKQKRKYPRKKKFLKNYKKETPFLRDIQKILWGGLD